MQKRRWYDKYTDASETVDLLRNLEETQQAFIANDISEITNSIKNYHKEKEILPLSIGLDRVFGLYNQNRARRWYDKSSMNMALRNMSTLPENDYINILEGLNTALKS